MVVKMAFQVSFYTLNLFTSIQGAQSFMIKSTNSWFSKQVAERGFSQEKNIEFPAKTVIQVISEKSSLE